jgi:hypothetical protein
MAIDWEEYLNVAKAHVSYDENVRPCEDAKSRCAMSRAYYAALKTTHEYVTTTWEAPDVGMSGGVHRRLPKWLKQQTDHELREIGEKLVRLRRKRDKADYESAEFPRGFHEAYKSVQDSDDIIRSIQNAQ